VIDSAAPGSNESDVDPSEPGTPTNGGPSAAPLDRDAATPIPLDAVALAAARLANGRTLDLRAGDAWAEAGRKVLRLHLGRMVARVPGVIAGEDAEEVHAMRVATRRMRAAWRVFGDGFERDAVRRYRGELRDIGGRLGAVRDLDVLIEILVAEGQRRSSRQRAALEPLLAAWRAEREARRVDLVATLGSERFIEFVIDYVRLVETAGHAAVATPPHTPGLVRNRMPATIWNAYQAVWAFDDEVATADLATLHQLRIAAKWLRYTLEFVREPLEPEALSLIRPVVALQDHLGSQHDQHVAGLLARAFVASTTLTDVQARSIANFVEHLDEGVERLGRSLGATWRPIAAASYRRGLGRAIARL
jgi:CHAD domain-containing protein